MLEQSHLFNIGIPAYTAMKGKTNQQTHPYFFASSPYAESAVYAGIRKKR